ncbi:MAG: S1C family serine protease [Acidimicrobiales bacterium]
MAVLDEVQGAVRAVANGAGPAVVGVGPGWGQGSGIVVGDGVVLTNAHNLRGDEASVSFGDDRTLAAQVSGIDVDGDLAVLSADTSGVEPLAWAESPPGLGAVVFGVANPGGRGLRVTVGLVSAVGRSFRGPRGRRVRGSLEHTAPLARGSSGGPIVDAAGRFLGLNTNRLGEGFYAAIPADADLKQRVDALGRGESTSRLRLGVGLLPGRAARHLRRSVGLADRDGLLVREVGDNTPAAQAGLRQGDLLTEAGGRALTSVDDLHAALVGLVGDQSLALGVVRGAEELELTVSFDAGPAEPEEAGS